MFASLSSSRENGLSGDGGGVVEREGVDLNGVAVAQPKKVLILMSDTGGGHRASAEAIKAAFEEFGDEYQVFVTDLWSEHTPWPRISTVRLHFIHVGTASPNKILSYDWFYCSFEASQPNPDDLGFADSILVEEVGCVRVPIVKNEESGNSLSTLVLRGSTDNILDDLERVVNDGVNTYKVIVGEKESNIVEMDSTPSVEAVRLKAAVETAKGELDILKLEQVEQTREMKVAVKGNHEKVFALSKAYSLYSRLMS